MGHRHVVSTKGLVIGLVLQACSSASPSPVSATRIKSELDEEPPRAQAKAFETSSEPAKAEPSRSSEASALDAGVAPMAEPVPPTGAKRTIRGVVTTLPAKSAQHAVVYLKDAPVDRIVDGHLEGAEMNFRPHVLTMTVGGTLTFTNNEPFPDTAVSPSFEKWDFGMVPSRASRTRKMTHDGVYTVLCTLHPNELGFIVVSPSSYFGKADKTGAYSIVDVPEGDYTIVAWAPRVKPTEQQVSVRGGDVALDFSLRR